MSSQHLSNQCLAPLCPAVCPSDWLYFIKWNFNICHVITSFNFQLKSAFYFLHIIVVVIVVPVIILTNQPYLLNMEFILLNITANSSIRCTSAAYLIFKIIRFYLVNCY